MAQNKLSEPPCWLVHPAVLAHLKSIGRARFYSGLLEISGIVMVALATYLLLAFEDNFRGSANALAAYELNDLYIRSALHIEVPRQSAAQVYRSYQNSSAFSKTAADSVRSTRAVLFVLGTLSLCAAKGTDKWAKKS